MKACTYVYSYEVSCCSVATILSRNALHLSTYSNEYLLSLVNNTIEALSSFSTDVLASGFQHYVLQFLSAIFPSNLQRVVCVGPPICRQPP